MLSGIAVVSMLMMAITDMDIGVGEFEGIG